MKYNDNILYRVVNGREVLTTITVGELLQEHTVFYQGYRGCFLFQKDVLLLEFDPYNKYHKIKNPVLQIFIDGNDYRYFVLSPDYKYVVDRVNGIVNHY